MPSFILYNSMLEALLVVPTLTVHQFLFVEGKLQLVEWMEGWMTSDFTYFSHIRMMGGGGGGGGGGDERLA